MSCLLCHSRAASSIFFESAHHRFFRCEICHTVYRDPGTFLSRVDEKARYLEHNNDPEDLGYQQFVSPVVKAVMRDMRPGTHGLDYGAGTGPVIAKLLRKAGYSISLYDPFFHPDIQTLKSKYDFIVACEVIEHFHRPLEEFKKLHMLLKPGGRLYCMTDPIDDRHDFGKWYYKDDPTHVIFYNRKNLEWIQEQVAFKELRVEGRLIVMQR